MALVFAFGELANYQRFVFIRATTNCMPGPRGPGFLFTCPPPKLLENRRLVHRVRATRLVEKSADLAPAQKSCSVTDHGKFLTHS